MIFWIACSLAALLVACSPREDQQNNAAKESGAAMQVQRMSDIDSGYRSSEDDWATFLTCWRDAVEKRVAAGGNAIPVSLNANRLALNGTIEYAKNQDSLAKIEGSIAHKLPKSYRDFALVSGGRWFVESAGSGDNNTNESHLNPISTIGRFKDVDPMNLGFWDKARDGRPDRPIAPSDYYRYGYHEKPADRQDDSQFMWGYLGEMVKVGELEQGTAILLNPREITADGEWEAWTLSFKMGANRYRSFAELMQHLAHGDVNGHGATFVPRGELVSACAGHLRTAANNP